MASGFKVTSTQERGFDKAFVPTSTEVTNLSVGGCLISDEYSEHLSDTRNNGTSNLEILISELAQDIQTLAFHYESTRSKEPESIC